MPGDRSFRPGPAAAVAAAVLLAPLAAAPARALSGHLQFQYQKSEQTVKLVNPDGTLRDTTVVREYWVQNYELDHTARLWKNTALVSQFTLTDLRHINETLRSRTPYGMLRLTNPLFGVSVSHRPTEVTSSISPRTFGTSTLASGDRIEVTSREAQSVVTAYLTAPRLPRLDASWVRSKRDADLYGAASTGLTRTAHLSYGLGALELRGGYSDRSQGLDGVDTRHPLQRSLDGSAAFTAVPLAGLSLRMQADLADTRRGAVGQVETRTRTQGTSLTGSYRRSPRWNANLQYLFRDSRLGDGYAARLHDHDGSLIFNLNAAPGLRLTGGGGVRTARTENSEGVLSYLTALATLRRDVRPGWSASADASHTTNWNPGNGAFGVETAHAGSRFHLRPGLDLLADLQVTANGDTAARGQRIVTQGSWAVNATPLRTISVRYSESSYRAGAGLFRAASNGRTRTAEVRWKPVPALDMLATRSVSGTLPRNDPRLTTSQVTLRWSVAGRTQLTSSYTNSSSTIASSVAENLSGREVWTTRLLTGIGRSVTLDTGFSVAQPGGSNEARQFDAAITRRFGR